jgi:hypothetical protein
MIFADDAGKLEKRIRELVCQKPGIKRSEIARSLSHKIPASRIEGALAWLVERGEIVHDRQGKADTYRPKPRGEGGKVGNHPLSPSVIAPNSPLPPVETKGTETVIPPIPPFPPPKNVQPATLADLFEWRAVNGVTFCRREDGGIWVTNEGEYLLTPAIEAAIHANQETLSAFVPKTEPPADPMGTDEFFVILKNSVV